MHRLAFLDSIHHRRFDPGPATTSPTPQKGEPLQRRDPEDDKREHRQHAVATDVGEVGLEVPDVRRDRRERGCRRRPAGEEEVGRRYVRKAEPLNTNRRSLATTEGQ